MAWNFWEYASEDDVNQLRSLDFERTAKESIQKADASLWARDAGQLLDQSRSQIGDMIGNTLNSVRSAVAEPVQKAVEPVQRAVQGGQQAADQFSEWAGSRLGEVRSKLPGYDALDQPSTTPARDDWRVGDQPSAPGYPEISRNIPGSNIPKYPGFGISPSAEGSGSALLDALNEHTSGGTSPAKVTAQPDSAPKKPADQPFPPDTTVTRDDWRQEWRPQLYAETPNAIPPWSGEQRGTVNPGLAPLDNALRQVQDLFSGSRANPNPGRSDYNGLYTDPATYGGNAVSATPHQIGINARDHLVGVMRDYWQASGGKEPDSDQGLSSIARVLTESMAHEVAHDTDAEHSRVHAATTKQISQADGSAGYQTIYNALKQMRDAGDLERVVDTAKAGVSPNPNEIAPPRMAAAGISPSERDPSTQTMPSNSDQSSPLLDALNAHTQQGEGGPPSDNPDQPSGLSGVPKESVTPTFTPADLETGNTQNGTVDLGDAAGKALEGAHNVVKTGVDFALGADEARAQWDKMEEIDRTAVDGGYYSAIDPRFIKDHPDLASEHSQAVMAVAGNLAGNAPEMHGPTPAHLAGAGDALRKIPGVQKVGEVLGGLRDAIGGATPEAPAQRPSPLDPFADTPLSPHEPGTPMATPLAPEDLPEGFKPGQVGSTAPDLPRGNPDDAASGAKTWAAGVEDPNKRYEFHYEVRPLYGLTTSHTDAFTPHPDFPAELQPRLRDRAASRDQINRIAGSLSPDALLAETHRLDSGPPIIGPDGVVESGNGRTLALRLAQQRYPEKFAEYQQAVREHAQAVGIDSVTLDAVPNPVLVRVRETNVDRPKFAAEANQASVLEMSPFEKASQDATRISPDLLSSLQVSESQGIDQALTSGGNRDVIRGIMATIPANERAGLMTETGELNSAGLQRVKSALFAMSYPGEAGKRLSKTFLESIDSGIKNVENGMFASLPAMSRAEGLIRTGQRSADLSLSNDLAAAVDVLARLRHDGTSVKTYLAQDAMFDRELSPVQEKLLDHLDSLSRSPRRIRNFIQGYADAVESEAHPDQADLFGETVRSSKTELMDRASGGAIDAGAADEYTFGQANAGPAAGTPEATATPAQGDRLAEPGPRAVPPENGGVGLEAQSESPAPSGEQVIHFPSRERPLRPPRTPGLPDGARPIQATDTAETGRLRLEKFTDGLDTEDAQQVRDLLTKSAKDVNWARDQRRGVIPDAASEQMADQIGRNVDQWIRQGKAGKSYNAEEQRALRNLVTGQAVHVAELSRELTAARTKGEDTSAMLVRVMAQGEKLAALVKVAEGSRAEAGRALRAFRSTTSATSPEEAVQRIYRKVGGPENAAKLLEEYQKLIEGGADAIKMAQFWARVEKPPVGFKDWFAALRYNSMLSGPRTFEVNVVGNALEIPWRLGRDVLASGARGKLGELGPEVAGLWAGMGRGSQAFMETLAHGISGEAAARGDLPRDIASRVTSGPAKATALALEWPGRIMQASDDFGRMAAYGMALGRRAAVIASHEKLSGDAWNARVAELVAAPPKDLMQWSLGVADRMTYHNEMGSLGQALAGVARVPYIGNIVLPFLKTVYNITSRGIDRSPVGIIGTAVDVARGAYKDGAIPKGAAPLGERLGDNVMGGLAGVWFIDQALHGNVSGAGPDDKEKREMLRSEGWQPYSLKIGGNWVSYANWGPVAVPLSLAAATAESQIYKKPGASAADQARATFERFAGLATEQTYLQSIGAVYKSLSEPDRYGGQWLTQFVTSLVPEGALLATVAQAQDQLQRRPEKGNIGQAVAARLPEQLARVSPVGTRKDVPVSTDVVGKPVPNQQAGGAAFQPLRVSQQRPSATMSEYRRLGVDFPQVTATKLGDTPLSPTQQRQYRDSAQAIRGQLTESLLASDTYKKADDEARKRLLQAATSRASAWAGQAIVPRSDREGYEFTTKAVGGDPAKAVDGYLKAVALSEQLKQAQATRYLGVKGPAAEQLMGDVRELGAFRQALGKAKGDLEFVRKMGAARYAKADGAQVDPRYDLLRKRVEADPNYATYFGSRAVLDLAR